MYIPLVGVDDCLIHHIIRLCMLVELNYILISNRQIKEHNRVLLLT